MRARFATARWVVVAFGLVAGVILPESGRTAGYLGEPRDSYTMFVIGDSLAGGLWAGLARLVTGDARFRVSGRFNEESGLARPDVYDWPRAIKGILDSNRFDIAVIVIGANDGRDLRVGGERLSYGSEQWVTAYRKNAADLIAALREAKVAVYWLGLPPMRAPEIDAVAKLVSDLQRQEAEAAGVRFLDIRREFANADGTYAESGFDIVGQFVRLRSRNGVNMIKSGNDKLASLVLARVKQDIEGTEGGIVAGEEPVTEEAVGERTGTAYQGPVFGRALADGTVIAIETENLPSPDTVAVAHVPLRQRGESTQTEEGPEEELGPDPASVLSALKANALPGSLAEKLFSTGESPPSVPGRLDDFRRPPAPAQ